jgi:nucleoside phosphorylase
MRTGDIVFDVQGAEAEWPPLARERAQALGLAIHFGRIAHSERVLSRPDEKAALGRERRAAAVDMESALVRAWAADRTLPAFSVRAVLDGLDETLPAELPEGEGAAAMARYALRHLASLPLLLSTGAKSRRAMSALSIFLADLLPRL